MTKLILTAKKYDLPLEINLLGIAANRNYPNMMFWELCKEISPKVILGCDAHSPARIANPDEIKIGMAFVDKYNLDLIDKLTLVDPFK